MEGDCTCVSMHRSACRPISRCEGGESLTPQRCAIVEDSSYPAGASLILCAPIVPDKGYAFAEWRGRWQEAFLESPGALNLEYVPPCPPDQIESLVVMRFDSLRSLQTWRGSMRNAALISEARPMAEGGIVVQLAGQASNEGDRTSSTAEMVITAVKPGMETRYRAWAEKIQNAQETFAGYRGAFTQPPQGKERGWTTVFRFDTSEHLDAWLNSEERAALLQEGEDLVLGFHQQRVDTSFPGWTPLDPATGKSPSMWKTAALVLLTLFPVVMLELRFLSPILHAVNPAGATFIGNAISVALTTWPLMQLAIRAFPAWLFPQNQPRWRVITDPLLILACYSIEIVIFWHVL
jgi:uncharacterized protein